MSKLPQDLIRPEIQALAAYKVPSSTGMIKLDAMENPYHLPENLRELLSSIVHGVSLNRYPDASCAQLKITLRDSMKIPAQSEIILGNGSDELIQIAAMALARPGAVLMAPEPSFVMYRQTAALAGMRYVGVPLTADFSLDMPAMLTAITREQPALIFLSYPNNPTGSLFSVSDIEAILAASPGLVIVDEAYAPFAAATFMDRLPEFSNLAVMRTVSKLGLAALRLGYMAASPAWIEQLDKLRMPYNINTLTQVLATRLLGSHAVLDDQAAAIVAERGRLATELSHMRGVTVFPSHANFILLRVTDANVAYAGLRTRRILVKNLHGSHPSLDQCLRVTVGTPTENDAFLAVLAEVV